VLNIPGPGTFDESGVLTATGPWLFFFLPGDLDEGSPPILAYAAGRVRIDETGFHLLAGRQVDLCPQRLDLGLKSGEGTRRGPPGSVELPF
jgi:hypothetical protein